MTTDDKPVRSIHAENLARRSARTTATHKGQLNRILIIAGVLSIVGTSLLSTQAILHCAARWLHAFAGLERTVATHALYNSIRLLFEEFSPCQA